MAAWRHVLVSMCLLLSAGVAHAKDFCFNSTSPKNPAGPDDPDLLVVAQGFKVPKKGKCRTDGVAGPCGFTFDIS